jgi:predicted metalloprotease with PDZ domain
MREPEAASRSTMNETIRYTIRFPNPETHYMEVAAEFHSGGGAIEMMMPVWSPGSYLVREYARNVENVVASDASGAALALEKISKNRWRIPEHQAGAITFRYRVYGRELRVQSNFIDGDFALVHGPATFIAPADQLRSRFEVEIELPHNWLQSLSGLRELEKNRFEAADFDELLDCPIVAGSPAVHSFEVDSIPHLLVNIGGETFWDGPRAARDVAKIVEAHRRMWGALPYDRYLFFNFIVDSAGGLEHRN